MKRTDRDSSNYSKHRTSCCSTLRKGNKTWIKNCERGGCENSANTAGRTSGGNGRKQPNRFWCSAQTMECSWALQSSRSSRVIHLISQTTKNPEHHLFSRTTILTSQVSIFSSQWTTPQIVYSHNLSLVQRQNLSAMGHRKP